MPKIPKIYLSLIFLFASQVYATEEQDKKIDQSDFGKFYPQMEFSKPSHMDIDVPKPNIFSRPSHTNGEALIAKGAIKIANWVDDIPQFKVLFEGQETWSDENGFFSFAINDTDLQKYRLILARKIQHVVNKKNTFATLNVIPNKNYQCYSFKKLGHNQGLWLQKEKRLSSKNFVIPKNSIVVLIDPKYVEKIEEWNLNLPDNFIRLPRIVLKSNTKPNKLKRVSAKSLLCLEDSVFHEKTGRENSSPDGKVNNKVKVSLP